MEWVRDPELMADPSLASDDRATRKEGLHHGPGACLVETVDQVGDRRGRTTAPLPPARRYRRRWTSPTTRNSSRADTSPKPLFQVSDASCSRAAPSPESGDRRWRPAPTLGQHNAEILTELGYTDADHQALVEIGAV